MSDFPADGDRTPTVNWAWWIRLGILNCGIAVALGAFGSHVLSNRFAEWYGQETLTFAGELLPKSRRMYDIFMTATTYQMSHGIALLVLGSLAETTSLPSSRNGNFMKRARTAARCFAAGNILFAGGLYAYTLTESRILAAVPPPVGGSLYVIGWLYFFRAGRMLGNSEPQ